MSAHPAHHPPDPPHRLDLRGCSAGLALLKLGQAMRGAPAGARLELVGSDARLARDLPMVAAGLGLSLASQSRGRGVFRFSLVKGPDPGQGPDSATKPNDSPTSLQEE
ncbi:MAG: hypothetical protein V1797_15550 [Pseudomonadota bacterium]